jgi:acid phosphatase family membrane protein YuiD
VARAAWARRQAVEHLLFGRPLRFPGDGADPTVPGLNGAQRLAMSAALVAVVAEAAATGGAALSASSSSLLPTLPGNGFNDLFTNRVFLAGYWAWFAAQLLKIFTKRARKGVWDVRAIVDSGGMPSSHSALCAGITTALAMQQGLGSSAFAMGVAFTAVVMYDAAGVRRHAGRQAEVLNAVLGELLDDGHALSSVKLKEVLGHTPLQVVMGAVLGVMVGIFFPAV